MHTSSDKQLHVRLILCHFCSLIERQNHARDLLKDYDLSGIDGIVIASGDGLLYEVECVMLYLTSLVSFYGSFNKCVYILVTECSVCTVPVLFCSESCVLHCLRW